MQRRVFYECCRGRSTTYFRSIATNRSPSRIAPGELGATGVVDDDAAVSIGQFLVADAEGDIAPTAAAVAAVADGLPSLAGEDLHAGLAPLADVEDAFRGIPMAVEVAVAKHDPAGTPVESAGASAGIR